MPDVAEAWSSRYRYGRRHRTRLAVPGVIERLDELRLQLTWP
ncbi:hypothetical protein ACIBL3_06925 [Kribbella sp. NPDC050124]